MKKSLRLVTSILALSVSLYCAQAAPAQQEVIAGGYTQISNSSQEVVSAARFAAREQGPKQGDIIFVDSIKSAERQVVAGVNYRLLMKVWLSTGKLQDVRAVIHKNLDDEYSLTSWDTVGNPTDAKQGFNSIYASSPVEQLMKAIDDAYAFGKLAGLDARRPYLGRVRIVIEHSLAADGEKGQFEIRRFRTLAQADRWLKSREREGLPARETRPLYDCGGGSCEFDLNGGILHNHLYLTKVTYGMRRGRPYIKTIYLLDGD
ncbi:MAG TPA: cystatin domain-containing protein [Pyrinomonadaceae bacterium]|nr:cystatin domain-containing protein [Pyrinomonadaceae bacterium]